MVGSLFIFAALPFVTRLYGPAAIGLVGVLLALSGLLAPLVKLGLVPAIQTGSADSRERLIRTALLSLAAFAVWLPALYFVLGRSNLDRPGGASEWILLAGFVLTTTGVEFGSAYAIRRRELNRVAFSRAIQGFTTAFLQVAFGLVIPSATSLLIAQLLGTAAAIGPLAGSRTLSLTASGATLASGAVRRPTARKDANLSFHANATIGEVFRSLALQAPVLITALYYAPEIVGQVVLAVRLVSLPHAYLGVGRGYFVQSEVAKLRRAGEPGHVSIAKAALKAMTPLAILVFGFGVVASFYFNYLFGPEFDAVGLFFRILAPAYALQVIAGPVTATLLLLGRDADYARALAVRAIGSGVGGLVVAAAGATTVAFLAALSVGTAIGYALTILLAMRACSSADSLARRG